MNKLISITIISIPLTLPFSANAAEKNPIPRFVSLRPNEANARVGPGPEYPIKWIFVKAGLPVEVTAEFDTWRRIRDVEGSEGWIHQNLLSSKRRAVIKSPEALVHRKEDLSSPGIVRLQQGVIVDLSKCHNEFCYVQIQNYKGWIKRSDLWGVYPKETIK